MPGIVLEWNWRCGCAQFNVIISPAVAKIGDRLVPWPRWPSSVEVVKLCIEEKEEVE